MSLPAASYHPCQPQDTDYYHCVEDYFETFVQEYDNRFSRQYGFWRPYIEKSNLSLSRLRRFAQWFWLMSNVKTAATNTCWRFLVKDGIFAPLATRNVWWNSANGSAWMSSKRCPHRHFIFSIPGRLSAGTFCMIENFLPPLAVAPGNP